MSNEVFGDNAMRRVRGFEQHTRKEVEGLTQTQRNVETYKQIHKHTDIDTDTNERIYKHSGGRTYDSRINTNRRLGRRAQGFVPAAKPTSVH